MARARLPIATGRASTRRDDRFSSLRVELERFVRGQIPAEEAPNGSNDDDRFVAIELMSRPLDRERLVLLSEELEHHRHPVGMIRIDPSVVRSVDHENGRLDLGDMIGG